MTGCLYERVRAYIKKCFFKDGDPNNDRICLSGDVPPPGVG